MPFGVTNIILLWQNVCHDELTFVTTNACFSWQNILLSRQKYACRNKAFVMTNTFAWKIFCRDKHNCVLTKVLSQHAYFCCDKRHVLSQQKWHLWQLPPVIDIHAVCRHRNEWSAQACEKACTKRKAPSQALNPDTDRVGTPCRLANKVSKQTDVLCPLNKCGYIRAMANSDWLKVSHM